MLPGETVAQYAALPPWVLQSRQDAQWARGLTDGMPTSWVGKLLERWRGRYGADYRAANLEHLAMCRAVSSAQRAGLQPDAGDGELCEEARQSARDMQRRVDQRAKITPAEWPEGVKLLAKWAEVNFWLQSRGLGDAVGRLLALRAAGRSVLARVACDRWWRRVLRRVHSRAIEATARGLGLVHKGADCYVSADGLRQRRGQVARNARALEAVSAVNEYGQAFTLADLAAKGPACREIRRHELMTRIAGFEHLAKEADHVAFFITVTCPSRMHRMRTAGGWRVEENPKWDGTAPDEAQRYLTLQWARARAAASRAGLRWYGFRIAEPNHDGTPHWHMLLFFPRETERGVLGNKAAVAVLRRYFLHNDNPNEPGAERHRVKVVRIDWMKGSAAGYVAKYVAKNIDGYKVEQDLYGNDALTSSARVDAWAARWSVRQFQQLGGAPVTVWRELRRLHDSQAKASPSIDLALEAVNLARQADGVEEERVKRYTAAHGWATYTELQGGATVRRAGLRFWLLKESTGETGRYGDTLPAKVCGIERVEVREIARRAFGLIPAAVERVRARLQVESERCQWLIVGGSQAAQKNTGQGEALPPWSPVNNCTAGHAAAADGRKPDPVFQAFAGIDRRPKRGRWNRYPGGGAPSKESQAWKPPNSPPKPTTPTTPSQNARPH